ncbi:MAG: organic hydroperoxide resistance protein [Demequina sp.]|uniref:organic hydroperoxide resistance protein n=1 Tax=Demequina sp. TaxID=2050685 RepID=UPI003A8551CD
MDKPQVFYTAVATATGSGRDGHVATDDGLVEFDLATPKPGAAPTRTNPEQLFAAGYAACFNSALQMTAKREKSALTGAQVTAEVGIGQIDSGGFGLTVTLKLRTEGVDQDAAQDLAEMAHQVCPYSNATRGNIEVNLEVTAA